MNAIMNLNVGDIVYGMWHYSMHYPVFFKVTKVSDKRAKAVRLFGKMVKPTDGGYGQQGYEIPDEHRQWGEDEHIIREGKHGLETGSYQRCNHYSLEKWNGEPIWADYMD